MSRADGLPDTVAARCTCGRKLAPLPLQRSATVTGRRTCRGCGTRWQVTVEPIRSRPGLAVHVATLVHVGGAR